MIAENPVDTVRRIDRLRSVSLGIGAFGFAASVLGAIVAPSEFQRALLIAFLYWLGVSLGSLALLMVHQLTGGRWGFTVQRILEAALRPLPLLAVLFLVFLPLGFGLAELYPWANSDALARDPALQFKSAYLDVSWFWLRFAAYFAVWLTLSSLLSRWSLRQDATDDPAYGLRMRAMSGPGLLAYGILASFASVDWIMSLTPHWFSSIQTLFFVVGHALTALAFAVALLGWLSQSPSWSKVVSPETSRRLGMLLLVFVLLWAYMAFSQYLIIWSGDLPEEITWYLARASGGWEAVALFLVLFHLAVPLAILAFRRTKERQAIVAWLAGLLLVARWVDLQWLITPTFSPNRLHVHWLDATVFVGVGGFWIAIALGRLVSRPLLPTGDARFDPHAAEQR